VKKVAFDALIQQVTVKSLRTGDKSVRITLEIDSPPKGFVADVDALHEADRRVAVAFAEKVEE
jgi:hypothetical protein